MHVLSDENCYHVRLKWKYYNAALSDYILKNYNAVFVIW